jgi:hypothetical protein
MKPPAGERGRGCLIHGADSAESRWWCPHGARAFGAAAGGGRHRCFGDGYFGAVLAKEGAGVFFLPFVCLWW